MPKKHTRKGEIDKSLINLPPTQLAIPLPPTKSAKSNGIFTTKVETSKRPNKKRKTKSTIEDDTPKAFLRLMSLQQGKRLPKGLDDGIETKRNNKKKKTSGQVMNRSVKEINNESENLKIRPGEKMSEFGARVDAALPVKGLINKSTRKGLETLGSKDGRTRMEKRMHKIYDQWRLEEAKRIEQRQRILELAEEEEMDEDGQVKWKIDIPKQSKCKKGNKKLKKKIMIGENDDGEDDPWAKLLKIRGEEKIGLHDVAQAPPIFSNLPRKVL
ncbi:putative urease accessory protein [Erysiphe neolycopersici]|uniref:Putative urease accessory protein n=1 Tax=Erysiphe neolycopersici TaxID=212602 RepID=A0A420I0Z3_9PEZI|nr:putative urease accessory protein [Erysiphe neolycopersici]